MKADGAQINSKESEMPNQYPGSLIPMIIMMISILVLIISMAIRKGQSVVLFAIFGLIPFINVLSLVYLLSMTDREVLDKLNTIIEKINK